MPNNSLIDPNLAPGGVSAGAYEQAMRKKRMDEMASMSDAQEVYEAGLNRINIENGGTATTGGTSLVDPNTAPTQKVNPSEAWSNYVNSIYGASQKEQDEKKKKAAKWVTAAQMLADSFGALANVYWTGKGADAQKLDTEGALKGAAATSQMEQDIRNAQVAAAKAEVDKVQAEYERQTKEDREKWERQQAEQARQDRLAKEAKDGAREDRRITITEGQAQTAKEQGEETIAIRQQEADTRQYEAETNRKKVDNANNGGGSGSGGKGNGSNIKPAGVLVDDKLVNGQINTDLYDNSNYQQIVNTLPGGIRERYGLQGEITDKLTDGNFKEKVERAIGEALEAGNKATIDRMMSLGLLTLNRKENPMNRHE